MNLFRSIKKAFDPNNILNPGKMGLWVRLNPKTYSLTNLPTYPPNNLLTNL
jgi:hypothetical protein